MGKNIKVARIKADLTQKELAKRAGITSKYLSQMETGVSCNPSKPVMERLAKELGVTPQELFFDKE